MKRFLYVLGFASLYAVFLCDSCFAQAHNQYYSWHQEAISNYYCSTAVCQSQSLLPNETCEIDRNSCPEGVKIVQNGIAGYKKQNNINDPKITINQEFWNGREPADDVRVRLANSNFFNVPLDNRLTDRFRVFIPPGVEYFALGLFCPQNDHVAVAIRWNQPPCETCRPIHNSDDYRTFQFDRKGQYNLSTLESRDVLLQNSDGNILIYAGGPGMTVTEGGWLYVYTAYSRSATGSGASFFFRAEFGIAVTAGIYRDFYNNTNWVNDDPPERGGIAQHHLTVAPYGTGAGNITSNVGGIACSEAGEADCSKLFTSGTSVTLTAQAKDYNSKFVGWSGDCSSADPTCTLTMDGTKNVTAIFNRSGQPEYSIRVTKAGDGAGGVTSTPAAINCDTNNTNTACYAEFEQGTPVTLTATPGTGSLFSGWEGCTGSDNQCTVTVDGVKRVTAKFNTQSTRQFTVTALMTTSGGSVAPSRVDVYSGATAAFTVTHDSNHVLDEQIEDTCDNSGTLVGDTYTTGPVTADCKVTFKFRPKEIRHTVTAWAGNGGKIVRSATDTINPLILTVIDQQSTTINVKPDDGFRTNNQVSGNCDGALNGNVYTMNMVTANCTAVFSFTPVEYSVAARLNDPNAGSIDAYERTVVRGHSASFTVMPRKDYAIEGVRATGSCGDGVWFDNTYTINPTGNDCVLTFGLQPAARYDLYHNLMVVPCLRLPIDDEPGYTDYRLLMTSPAGMIGAAPSLVTYISWVFEPLEGQVFIPEAKCAVLSEESPGLLHVPCFTGAYEPHCREMNFIGHIEDENTGELIFQLQPRQVD